MQTEQEQPWGGLTGAEVDYAIRRLWGEGAFLERIYLNSNAFGPDQRRIY